MIKITLANGQIWIRSNRLVNNKYFSAPVSTKENGLVTKFKFNDRPAEGISANDGSRYADNRNLNSKISNKITEEEKSPEDSSKDFDYEDREKLKSDDSEFQVN